VTPDEIEALEAAYDAACRRERDAKANFMKAVAARNEAVDATQAAWKRLMKATSKTVPA
jgi:hypothetical protein